MTTDEAGFLFNQAIKKDFLQFDQVKTLGKFILLRKLGTGAAGEVYLADDTSLKRRVALKILTRLSDQDVERFYREARACAKLNHSNITHVYEVGEVEGRHYISMQYIDGYSLDRLELDINESLRVIRDIARAVDHAHKNNIVHRDIKPSNIILDKEQKAYLMDFGIAKRVVADKTGTLSLTGSIIGTPAFMSPEQARGEIHNIDPKTDIYGLGATLYYLLTRTQPFLGSSTVEIINKVQHEEPAEPRNLNKKIPKDVETIVMTAMAKEKTARYQTASNFIHDIELYLSGEPIMAKRASIATRILKKARRKKSTLLVLLFMVVMISAGLYILYKEREKNRRQEQEQTLQKEANSLLDKGLLVMNQALKESYNNESDPVEIRKQLEDAIQIISQAIDKYPLTRAYYYRGKIYRELARYAEAQKDLSSALNLDPKIDIARIEMVYVRAQDCIDKLALGLDIITPDVRESLDESMKDIESIKEERFVSEEVRQMRIFIFAIKKVIELRFDDAISLLTQFKGWDKNEDFLHWLGAVYCLKGDYNLAVDYITKALKIRPHYARPYLSRASAYQAKGELMKAMDDLDKAIYTSPWFANAYIARGNIYFQHEQFDKALEDFNRVIGLMPESEAGYVNRGNVLRVKGDLNAALNDCNKAIKLNPSSTKAYSNRGGVYDDLKEHDKAISDYNKAISIDINCYSAYYNRGVTYYVMSNLDQALADWRKCIELMPRDPRPYIKMGGVLAAKKDIQGALNCFNKALQINKDFAQGYMMRGLLYFNTGSYDLAEADLKKAIELDPRLSTELEPVLNKIKRN